MIVRFNNKTIIEIDTQARYSGVQRRFLDEMEQDMDSRGVRLNGELVTEPTDEQKSAYVALTLCRAIESDNSGLQQASCAYLSSRNPDTQCIAITSCEQGYQVRFHNSIESNDDYLDG